MSLVASGRVDLAQHKTRLNYLLGDKQNEYWNTLKEYVNGRVGKQSLDELAAKLLGKRHLHIHNQFIRGIHFNAQLDVPPPPSSSTMVLTQAAASAGDNLSSILKRTIQTQLSMKDVRLLMHQLSTRDGFDCVDDPRRPAMVQAESKRPLFSEECMLNYSAMKDRVSDICQSNGLQIPTDTSRNDDLFQLMSTSLELYLKNIMSSILYKTKFHKIFHNEHFDNILQKASGGKGSNGGGPLGKWKNASELAIYQKKLSLNSMQKPPQKHQKHQQPQKVPEIRKLLVGNQRNTITLADFYFSILLDKSILLTRNLPVFVMQTGINLIYDEESGVLDMESETVPTNQSLRPN